MNAPPPFFTKAFLDEMTERPSEDKSIGEQLTEGSDLPLGKKVPGGPFALVGLSYLVVLLFVSVVMILVMYSYSG